MVHRARESPTWMDTPPGAAIDRIGLLAPMPSELRPLVSRLGLSKSVELGPGFLVGAAGGIRLVATRTGIGMQRAADATRRLLEAASPDHVVVVGIAGGIGAAVAIGDLIVPETVLDLESGESFRSSSLGDPARSGVLASSDRLIESPDRARQLEASGVMAIDMETAAVARVCSEHGCAWSAFRAVSDRADDGTTDGDVFGLAGPDGTPNLAAVARFVVGQPHRIPQLFRLARGASLATRRAAGAAAAAIRSVSADA